ncbi:MAG: peptidylprolyl isomerase [Gammaproteobacteria bacterium]|jgi:peptidyl-prolyl cis-trans isomerase SurA
MSQPSHWLSIVLLSSLPLISQAAVIELDRIVAVVEEDVIMETELDEQMQRVRAALRQQGTQMPPTTVLERQVIERLVLEKIQLQIAEQSEITVDEPALDRAVSDLAARNNLSLEQFREILASEGYEFSNFREQIRQEMIMSKLRRAEIDNRVRVSDNEIENYLRNEALGNDDQEYRLAHILISIPSGADNEEIREAREKARVALERLDAGEDFTTVAVSVSDGQQALEGGDLGWRKGDEIPTLFADAVGTMSVGETSGLITSPSGYHIIKLTDKRSGETIMIEQFRARHILLKPNELMTPEQALNRIRQIKLRLDGGADFALIARTNSDDRASALQGGDLGWVGKGQMVAEFEEIMTAIPVGEISPPFQTEFGFHILQVTETRQYDGTEEIRRDRARQALRRQKIDERRQSWLRELRDEAYVDFRDVLIEP